MKKARNTAAIILAVTLFCLSLAGCGELPKKSGDTTEKETTTRQPVSLREEKIEETADVSLSIETFNDTAEAKATIRGLNEKGEEIWTYVTEKAPVSELDPFHKIALTDDGFYFCDAGTIRCLGVGADDGGVLLWENDDFGGASVSSAIGDDGTMYLAGTHGPILYVVKPNGDVVNKVEELDKEFAMEFYWPSNLELTDKGVYVYSAGLNYGIVLDPETGKVVEVSEIIDNALMPAVEGVWTDDPKAPNVIIGVNGDGTFKAVRCDKEDDINYGYEGKWELAELETEDYGDGEPKQKYQTLFLTLDGEEKTDPLMKGFTSLGDFGIDSFSVDNGVLTMKAVQMNNGDSIFSMMDEDFDFEPTLYKIAGNVYDYEFPALM